MKITLNEQDIYKLVKETVNKLLNEGLGVGSFPNNGYCLILAGGPGSGKSYLLNNDIVLPYFWGGGHGSFGGCGFLGG